MTVVFIQMKCETEATDVRVLIEEIILRRLWYDIIAEIGDVGESGDDSSLHPNEIQTLKR